MGYLEVFDQKRKIYLQMLKAVAEAIGPDYLDQVVFVGGCTTVLFMDENDADDDSVNMGVIVWLGVNKY